MKAGLKRLATGLAGLRISDPSRRVAVLCYHSVHPTKSFASATPEQFTRQVQWLAEHCEVIRFSAVTRAVEDKDPKRPRVAITFDDGYADNYEYAFPILQTFRLPATFFLTAGLLENDAVVVQRFEMQRRSLYQDIRPLTWPQVRQMAASGYDIGAHTYSHPNLAHLDAPAVKRELTLGKEILQQRLGQSIDGLAYPYGKPGRAFNSEVMKMAAEVGYKQAAAVIFRGVRPKDSPLKIPRFFVARDEPRHLKDKLSGAWDMIGWWQEGAPGWLARIISPEDFVRN